MITLEKLNIFEKYKGHGEGFLRFGKEKDKAVLSEEEWSEIEELLRQVYLVENNLASNEIEVKMKLALDEKIESSLVKTKLISFANAKWYP